MTGLVYLAIIALWVAFLIPWLGRQRDEHAGKKTADRYHLAMDTLARARKRSDPASEGIGEEVLPDEELRRVSRDWSTRLGGLFHRQQGQPTPAARRRRSLLLLLGGASLATGAAAIIGVVPALVPVACALLFGAYGAAVVRVTRRGASAGSTAGAEADRYRQATRRAQAQARGMLQTRDEHRQWDPRPTMLPTYVTKPSAPTVPRVVEFPSTRGEWSGQALLQAAQAERQRAAERQFAQEVELVEQDPDERVEELVDPTQPLPRVANG